MKAKKPEPLAKVLFKLPKIEKEVTVDLASATILFCLWAVGAGLFTFRDPFTVTSNGYFACWGALGAAGKHMQSCWVASKGGGEAPPKLKASMSTVQAAAHNVKAQIGALLVWCVSRAKTAMAPDVNTTNPIT